MPKLRPAHGIALKPLLLLACVAAHGVCAEQMAFVERGKAKAVRTIGNAWTRGKGCLECAGTGNFLLATRALGAGDFAVRVRLSLARLDGTAASFVLGDAHFGFDGRPTGRLFVEGGPFGKTRFVGDANAFISPGKPFELEVIREGSNLSFHIGGRRVWSAPYKLPRVRRLGLRPHRATMRV